MHVYVCVFASHWGVMLFIIACSAFCQHSLLNSPAHLTAALSCVALPIYKHTNKHAFIHIHTDRRAYINVYVCVCVHIAYQLPFAWCVTRRMAMAAVAQAALQAGHNMRTHSMKLYFIHNTIYFTPFHSCFAHDIAVAYPICCSRSRGRCIDGRATLQSSYPLCVWSFLHFSI